MAPQTTHLLLPEDLEDDGKTSSLEASDRDALRAVSKWVKSFVARPHKDLGRDGTVCPFVPGALQRRTLFLAPERVNDVLGELATPSYEEDGIIFGPFYEGNQGTAIYNPSFLPFQSPVPFLFVRHTVLSDWKFCIDDPERLSRWARRFGPSGTSALAEELRRLPWRVGHA